MDELEAHFRMHDETNLGPPEFETGGQPTNAEYERMGSNWRPGNQPTYTRPWLFFPGDKVLCLWEDQITAGTVIKVQIPGPMRPDKIIFVDPEEGFGYASWWDPDHVERIGQ